MISRLNRSFWLYGLKHAHFDFRQPNYLSILTTEPRLHIRFNLGPSLPYFLKEFAQKFGTTKPLPDWVHRGAMMGLQGGEKRVLNALEQLKEEQAVVSSVWIQDWIGSIKTFLGHRLHWNWNLDTQLYPHWSSFVAELRQRRIEVVSYFNPRIIYSECKDCTFETAQRNNYFIKDQENKTLILGNGDFSFAKLNLFSEKTRLWFSQLIRDHFEEAPVKGWMADFSEALPKEAQLPDGRSGTDAHNAYIYEWAKLNGQLIDEIDEGFVFMRGGILGSHRHIHAFWLGDQLTSWDRYDGLHSTIIGLISSGLSGALVNHSDIGGMTGLRIPFIAHIQRSKELFLRWMQLNAFTPIFRTHEGLWPKKFHQFDSDHQTLQEFARYSRIFASLFPYRKKLLAESQQTGLPLIRGLFLAYPHLQQAWEIDDQFMLGNELLIAPIVRAHSRQRSVFLPAECWQEVFTQQIYLLDHPQSITVSAPLDHIPVFALCDSQSLKLLTQVLHNH